MRPCWVHLFFLVNTCLRETEIGFLDIGQRSEYVLLDHLHNFIQVRDDHANYIFLVLEHLLEFLDCIKSLSLALDILSFVLVIIILHAELQLLDERFFGVLVGWYTFLSAALGRSGGGSFSSDRGLLGWLVRFHYYSKIISIVFL